MIRTFAAALIASLAAASTALAQSGTPARAASPTEAAVATAPAAPALRQDARLHDDADARECLEFLTNIGVIRCAEKYRNGARRPQR